METKTRRTYSPEFKREAVALASRPGQTVVVVPEDLGIEVGLIRRWRRELSEQGRHAFVRQGVARDEELMALRREGAGSRENLVAPGERSGACDLTVASPGGLRGRVEVPIIFSSAATLIRPNC